MFLRLLPLYIFTYLHFYFNNIKTWKWFFQDYLHQIETNCMFKTKFHINANVNKCAQVLTATEEGLVTHTLYKHCGSDKCQIRLVPLLFTITCNPHKCYETKLMTCFICSFQKSKLFEEPNTIVFVTTKSSASTRFLVDSCELPSRLWQTDQIYGKANTTGVASPK